MIGGICPREGVLPCGWEGVRMGLDALRVDLAAGLCISEYLAGARVRLVTGLRRTWGFELLREVSTGSVLTISMCN